MMAPWVAIGIASIALVVALVSLFDRGSGAAGPVPFSPPMSSAVPGPEQPPDLSTMTPRQAADRLFNRVMAASESGNIVEALRFAPMALQAYDSLETLDNDARFHVALIHLTVDDLKSARAQLDKLRQSAPNHLLGFFLEHQIAERSGNKDDASRASKAFLAAYDTEITQERAEYRDHRDSIERFRKSAQASKTGNK